MKFKKTFFQSDHVESPERITIIHQRHVEFNLLERTHRIKSRKATEEEILMVHTQSHLDFLKDLKNIKLRDLHSEKNMFNSVYLHPDSYESACTAAGCALEMVDTILSGISSSGVCVIRPPGHHACEDQPSGFCLLNNVAMAAKYAITCHDLKRILILDWDVHHGNGTQEIFQNDPKVLYVSVHRYDNATFFPNSTAANYDEVGTGKGQGYNVNIPWNKRGMGDLEYISAFTQIILPIAYEYNPELVIISAGFDACVGDPLGGCKVSPEAYGLFTHWLSGLAGGKVLICLEGGYNVRSISYAMTMCTKSLLGDPLVHSYEKNSAPHSIAIESINNVISVHKNYWRNLKFQLALPKENVLMEPEPSRGLIVTEGFLIKTPDSDFDRTGDSGFSNFDSSVERNFSLNDSEKLDEIAKDSFSKGNYNIDSSISLEDSMQKMTIEKCVDGINCGSDDEIEDIKNTQESSFDGKPKPISVPQKDTPPKTLVDYLSENMQAIVNEEMFAVIPLNGCPHLDLLYVIPPDQTFAQGTKCSMCNHTEENWICLHCFITACGRYVNSHMQSHFQTTNHALVLSLRDLSAWCNICEAYVDHPLLYDAKNLAHISKFGEEMPWSYADRQEIHMG